MEQRKHKDDRILGIQIHGIGKDTPILLPQSKIWVAGSDKSAALDAEIKKYNGVEYLRLVSALSTLRWSAPDVFAEDLKKANLQPHESLRDYQLQYLKRIARGGSQS